MKRKTLLLAAITPVLFAAAVPSIAAPPGPDHAGAPAPSSAADYTVNLTPGTKYVNVHKGDTVRFVAGDKQFTWNFNSADDTWAVGLRDIAPSGMIGRDVTVYVSQFRRGFGREDSGEGD